MRSEEVTRDSGDTGDSLADDSWFRVRVCLAHFFRDERRRALVLAPRRRRARWLLRRVRALRALPPRPRLQLLAHGHLLPRREPLALLRPDDTVTVVPAGMTGDGDVPVATDVSTTTKGDDEPDATFDRKPSPPPRPAPSSPPRPALSPPPGRPALSPPPGRPDDDALDELTASKRRALRLLERYDAGDAERPSPPAGAPCSSSSPRAPRPQSPADVPDAPAPPGRTAPRRRRVRRRRKVTPLPLDAADDDVPTEAPSVDVRVARVCEQRASEGAGPAGPPGLGPAGPPPARDAPSVLRCGGRARPPRRVPALPPVGHSERPQAEHSERPQAGHSERPLGGLIPGALLLAPLDSLPEEFNFPKFD